MKVVAIIQARMNSTRLKNKMLLPLCGEPLIARVIERVQRATRLDEVVLAFPLMDYESFRTFATSGVFLFPFSGDESDLVERYLRAARANDADIICRIPGDNPCVDPAYIDKAVEWYLGDDITFFSNTTDCVGGQWVDGIGAEVFSLSRLKWLDRKLQGIYDKYHREHVHQYFYEKSCSATIFKPGGDDTTLRLDVNTQADYDFIADLYTALWPANHNFTISDILAYLETKKVTP